MSRTFIICAVASGLTAALLVAWPVSIINTMAVGAVIGVAVAVGFAVYEHRRRAPERGSQ
jgi:tetrahydromethanopterin S-methyltransferase subunit E